jgi:predicted N-formylglutamate amidohydrolase
MHEVSLVDTSTRRAQISDLSQKPTKFGLCQKTHRARIIAVPCASSFHPHLASCSRPGLVVSFGGGPTSVLAIHQLCHHVRGCRASWHIFILHHARRLVQEAIDQ